MSLPDRPCSGPVPEAEYDIFADIYPAWTGSAASATASLPFYVEAYLAADDPVVELGVGDGRIAVEAARRGCAASYSRARAPIITKSRRVSRFVRRPVQSDHSAWNLHHGLLTSNALRQSRHAERQCNGGAGDASSEQPPAKRRCLHLR